MNPNPVLIVEDDPDVRSCLQLLVENYFQVPTVLDEDGMRVRDLVQTVNPSLILLDLALPGVDGLSLLAELKGGAAHRQIPVVVVSSSPWGVEETRRRAEEAGCDVFFHKLYDFHRLVPLLSRYLDPNDGEDAAAIP